MLVKIQTCLVFVAMIFVGINADFEHWGRYSQNDDSWTGRWFPDRVTTTKGNSWTGRVFPEEDAEVAQTKEDDVMFDSHGRVAMGVVNGKCDDGQTNLTMDWDYSPINYTCFGPKIRPSWNTHPVLKCDHIPRYYMAVHYCMSKPIEYADDIPTFGIHRPLWPRYGEYKFVPRQRWVHTLEHGGVVLLYHPCVNPLELKRLKWLVTRCVKKHVITPYTLLSVERPLALVTWGCKLTMSAVSEEVVVDFIKTHALKGPEAIDEDGQFDEGLMIPANKVSLFGSDELCPGL